MSTAGSLLLVCEGAADQAFLNKFLEARTIPGNWLVEFPKDKSQGFGKSGIPDYLRAVALRSDIVGVLATCDADDDPVAAQNFLAEAIAGAKEASVLDEDGNAITKVFEVYLLAGPDSKGCLETLLLTCVKQTEPQAAAFACAQQSLACFGGNSWNANRKAKALISILLAGVIEKDPQTSLTYIWSRKDCPFDLMHPALNPLADKLNEFARRFT